MAEFREEQEYGELWGQYEHLTGQPLRKPLPRMSELRRMVRNVSISCDRRLA